MLPEYADIVARLGPPVWWDYHGVPRYKSFHPEMCGVYARFVAYLEIGCQSCRTRFMVAIDRTEAMVWPEIAYTVDHLPTKDDIRWFHYGDPPRHNLSDYQHGAKGWEKHCSGTTMNCLTHRIVEFWRRTNEGWKRDFQYEITYPEIE